MFRFLKRAALLAAAFVRRLVVQQPSNDYERIAFDALYAAGNQMRKAWA